MPEAIRVGDLTEHGFPLQGAGSPDVLIGGQPAWRGMPEGAGDGLDEASKDTKAIMDVLPTPAQAFAPPVVVPKAAKIEATMMKVAAQVEAALKMCGPSGGVTAAFAPLKAATITLTAAYTSGAAVPGGEPAARVAFTMGYQLALSSAMGAAVAAMAGPWDMHTCPQAAPAPHGPGLVIKACKTVFINGLPAVVKGNQVIEAAGGPAGVKIGCGTVIIGDIAPASSSASSSSAAESASSGTGAPAIEGKIDGGIPAADTPDADPPIADGGNLPGGVHTPGHLVVTSETTAALPAPRTRVTLGIGEEVKLTASGMTGSVSWATSGNSSLSANSGESIQLTANDTAETVTITATDTCGCQATITYDVIEPSGVQMTQAPGTKIAHMQGIASIGMKTKVYVTPATVSFEKISVAEDDCVSVVTGYFVGTPADGLHHAGHGAGNWVRVNKFVAGIGSTIDPGNDTVQAGKCNWKPKYSAGTFTWAIPWRFRVGGGAGKVFATVNQVFSINAAGDMTASKAGASASAKLGDPTSGY
jgi:uncharacterized Zn-binding protein involved in type VI secretion